MTILSAAFALALASILAGSAARKARAPGEFRRAVAAYRLAPDGAAPIVAALVVVGEGAAALCLGLGAALSAPHVAGAGYAAAGVLFMAFGAAISVNLLRGRTDIDCGCGWAAPSGAARLTLWHALRAWGLCGACALGAGVALGAPAASASLGAGLGAAAALALPILIIYLAADVLIANWSALSAQGA